MIFGLQRFGGISNYWAKHVDAASADPQFEVSLLLPKRLTYVDFNADWLQLTDIRREMLASWIQRYFPCSIDAKCSVFHTPYYRLPQRRVGKYVVTAHDFTYERYRTGLARFVHTKQKLASLRRADTVLCVSASTRDDVLEFCPDIDAGKLKVIHLGVDSRVFYREPAVPSDTGDKTVLFVGQRGGYKRFDLAVEAVHQSPQLSLGVVGPTLSTDELAFLRSRLGTRWREYGNVSTADLRRLYSSAFAFIFPSDYEGFGLPILEAMACGCPVVAASLSSLPEVGGTAAYYAKSQSGESYACELNALDLITARMDAVQRGLARAAEFDWSHTFQKTKAVYLAP